MIAEDKQDFEKAGLLQKSPTVSVIVPNYNHAIHLRQRMDSIFSQTFCDFEVILLDDCSTDGSADVLAEYERHSSVKHFSTNLRNSGSPFFQWKKGLDLASGDFVWIAESDDMCESEFLQHAIKEMTRDAIGVFVSSFVRIDERGNRLSDFIYSDSTLDGSALIAREFLTYNYIRNASTVVFRRSLLSRVNWEVVLRNKYCGDWYFWVMIAGATKIVTTSRRHCQFRKTLSLTEEKEKMAIEEGLECYRWIASHNTIGWRSAVSASRRWRSRIGNSKLPRQQIGSLRKMHKVAFPLWIRFLALGHSLVVRIRTTVWVQITTGVVCFSLLICGE